MSSRKWAKETSILFAILLVAFALRMSTYKYPYLMAYDPFHHYKIAEYISRGNPFPEIWNLSLYPKGAKIGEPMGLYYVSVFLYKFLKVFGASFFSIFKLSTPLFGVFTLIPIYLIGKKIFNYKTSFFSILLLGFLPAFSYRTFSGFYRGDGFSAFFLAAGFYFFLCSFDSNFKRSILFSIGAGISFGLMGLVWNGFMFGFVILSLFVILYSIVLYLKAEKSWIFLSYMIAAGLGIVIIKYSIMVQPHAEEYIRDLIKYVYPASLAFTGLLEGIKYGTTRFEVKLRITILALLLLAFLGSVFKLAPDVVRNLLTGYGLVRAPSGFLQTIGELQPPTLKALWEKYSIISHLIDFNKLPMPEALTLLLTLFPIGLLLLLRELYNQRDNYLIIFLTVWVLASLFLFKTALRYAFLSSAPLALLGGLLIYKVEEKAMSRYRAAPLLTVFILLLAVVNGTVYASQQKPHITPEWYDALKFLETQDEGGVLTWWDYGSWIQGIAGFPTVLDTVNGQNVRRMEEIGKTLLEDNESEVMKVISKYQLRYAVISVDMIGQMTNLDLILGLNTEKYQYPILSSTGPRKIGGTTAEVYGDFYVFKDGENIIVGKLRADKFYPVEKVYTKIQGRPKAWVYTDVDPKINGAVYISKNDLKIPQLPIDNFIIYVPPVLENTLLSSLMLFNGMGFEDFKLIYANSQVRIYQIGG